jgi:hypothetical protein
MIVLESTPLRKQSGVAKAYRPGPDRALLRELWLFIWGKWAPRGWLFTVQDFPMAMTPLAPQAHAAISDMAALLCWLVGLFC